MAISLFLMRIAGIEIEYSQKSPAEFNTHPNTIQRDNKPLLFD